MLVFLMALVFPGVARADVDDFTINNFTADYYLSKEDPQGSMRVVEKIDLFYNDFNHGILRAIPKKYKDNSLKLHINQISSPSGAPAKYTTYDDSGNTVLKIGDPDKTVTGQHSYTIDYTIHNVVTFYGNNDELYWDINGDEWKQPIEQVTARFHLPNGLTVGGQKCFAGGYGSNVENCKITTEGNKVIARTSRKLQPYETLTAVIALPKGYFAAPTFADWWLDNFGKVLAVALPPLAIGLWAFRRWHRHGKDLKGRGVIIPEYESPDKLTPAEVGILLNYKLDPRDISATIIDLAVRKYIRIIETNQKKLLKDKKTYEFEIIKFDWTELKPHEEKILSGIMAGEPAGKTVRVSLETLKGSFYKVIQNLQSSLPKDMTKAGYFPTNPRHAGSGMYIAAGVSLFLAFLVTNWLSVGLVIAAVLVALLALLMPRRSAQGVGAYDAVKGLKLYMEMAEADRIKMMQSPNSPYAEKSGGPAQTVELFEKLLPFAIVLGVENEWAKQFEDIYRTPPDWYNGNWTTFNALYFTSSLNNSVSAMGSSFNPPSSSSGSGFSSGGGGFSGGGGGGGGGGGW